jgi:hypothetical protein
MAETQSGINALRALLKRSSNIGPDGPMPLLVHTRIK